ncbi:hypothetical protein O3P69_017644 [Scylla paramamosain]|uniref:Secreted protein n=1 Tax=Scylla paramamosain TaxID=85552 RepID=A0AAW0U062_SCYPA
MPPSVLVWCRSLLCREGPPPATSLGGRSPRASPLYSHTDLTYAIRVVVVTREKQVFNSQSPSRPGASRHPGRRVLKPPAEAVT